VLSITITPTLNKKFGELWSTDARDCVANVYPPSVDDARFAYMC